MNPETFENWRTVGLLVMICGTTMLGLKVSRWGNVVASLKSENMSDELIIVADRSLRDCTVFTSLFVPFFVVFSPPIFGWLDLWSGGHLIYLGVALVYNAIGLVVYFKARLRLAVNIRLVRAGCLNWIAGVWLWSWPSMLMVWPHLEGKVTEFEAIRWRWQQGETNTQGGTDDV